MKRRFLGFAAAMFAAAWALPALAEAIDPEPLKPVEPPGALPRALHGDKTQNLDRLFAALKVAPDDESAADNKDFDLAIRLLNAIIDIRPDFTEAWNRRATVYYTKKDFGRALADIHEVLAREPRHFGALSGLGIILQELGDEKHALDAFRRALAIHPHLERVPDLVKSLGEKIEGRDI